jgi:alpha-L-rhamnosidase
MKADLLRCEYKQNPLGIDVPNPRLNWQVQAEQRGARQTAYQILVSDSAEHLHTGQPLLWDSGKVASDASAHIIYAGLELRSRQRVWWQVRVWDENDQASAYSSPTWWEMGLLHKDDWQATWITSAEQKQLEKAQVGPSLPETPPATNQAETNEERWARWMSVSDAEHVTQWIAMQNAAVASLQPCPFLRKTFSLTKPVTRARIYASARGIYMLYLNGERVGHDYLRPGWTDYNKRIQYQTYDITDQLTSDTNAIGMILGDGWYTGYLGFQGKHHHYGTYIQGLAQIEIEYADGTSEIIITDGSWKATQGPILYADLFMGEAYDARRDLPGWSTASYDDSTWSPVDSEPLGKANLVAQQGPSVQKTEELTVREITEPTPGTYVYDLGQNMVGWVRLRVSGEAGQTVRLRFAEMLDPDGTVYVANLRTAKATEYYTLKGATEETYEPSFTFHGFRYVEVTGYPGKPGPDAITGIVIQSITPPTGTFTCSSPLVNQLVQNIVWGQRGNFLEVPTDCPQRDERLGWTGDAEIFVRTATYNEDVSDFFAKWLIDMEDAQLPSGGIPNIIPNIIRRGEFSLDGAPAWSDACIIVPWTIYQAYNDKQLLERHYAMMTAWIDYLDRDNPDHHWKAHRNNDGHGESDFGDWLSIDADTPKDVLADAFFAYSTSLLASIADVLGKENDARKYRTLAEQIKAAFNEAYVSPDGRILGDTQTAYTLALRFQILPEHLRARAAQYLADDIKRRETHLSTGFLGVGHLLPALTDNGQIDLAYQLLLQDTFPSWGYSIKHGATTIWERWDGWTAEKGFQTVNMNSFNHYSLGSVGEWLYRYVAGIDTANDAQGAGYKHIILHPHPNQALTFVSATFDSLYGPIESSWRRENGTFTWDITIPANTNATVSVPAQPEEIILESNQPAATTLTLIQRTQDAAIYELAAGSYHFVVSSERKQS